LPRELFGGLRLVGKKPHALSQASAGAPNELLRET